MHRRNPGELTTEEGFRLVDQVRAFGDRPPLLVLTGGDPMRRPDLAEIVRYAADAGLTVGTDAERHGRRDTRTLEGIEGGGLVARGGQPGRSRSGDTRRISRSARVVRLDDAHHRYRRSSSSLPLQINSAISRLTLSSLQATAARVAEFPLTLWALFFLIKTGRGANLEQISAEECERVLNYLYDLSLTSPFGIKTTEAPHYHRIVRQREDERRLAGLPTHAVERRRQLRAPRSVNDGNGFVFIDHLGNICPSGFLPAARGNVQVDDLADIYRHDELFVRLRNPHALLGKCGRCQFRALCGGSARGHSRRAAR